jgi:DNA-binding Lrp family transcriptional regulator
MSGERDGRKAVPMDAYSPWQLRREYGLKAADALVLMNMTMGADWRSTEWQGSYKAISNDTGLSRNTVTKAVAKLEAKGCIIVREPFRQGEFGEAVVELPLYPQMVKMTLAQQEARSESARVRAETNAQQTRTNRAANAQPSRTLTRLPDSDQDLRETRGSRHKGNGEVQDFQVSEAACRLCVCGEPVEGHPFSDHEPMEAAS